MAQQRGWMTTAVLTGGRAGRWGLALVEAAIAYTWLVSALNKILDPRFGGGLARQLQQGRCSRVLLGGGTVNLTLRWAAPALRVTRLEGSQSVHATR